LAPALGRIVGRDEAFPRDENAHHRAPNYKRRNKKLNRPTQRALDAGDCRFAACGTLRSQTFFWLRVFSAPEHYPRPPQRQ
ncbi:MAG TPA: hypothetical protein VI566_15570, partial [Xanthomonadales bacterium]|nr:hypothetical protein [Xanthomonadales bacterium]